MDGPCVMAENEQRLTKHVNYSEELLNNQAYMSKWSYNYTTRVNKRAK